MYIWKFLNHISNVADINRKDGRNYNGSLGNTVVKRRKRGVRFVIIIDILWFLNYELYYFNAKSYISVVVSREITMLWSMESKADKKWSRISCQHVLLFQIDNTLSVIRRRAVSVEWALRKWI